MRKSFMLFLGILMLTVMWCGSAVAAYYDEGNNGDSWETAYIIDSAEDFMLMLERANDDLYRGVSKYYKLTADLDLTAEKELGSGFSGHFEGQNHKVKINVKRDWGEAALFKNVQSRGIAIKNLNVEGSVRGYKQAGGIAAYLTDGTIENCSFTGTVEAFFNEDDKDDGNVRAGGIVAETSFAGDEGESRNIINCTFSGTVKASASSGNSIASGGIIGYGSRISIKNCTTKNGSEILLSGSGNEKYIGGIAGMSSLSRELIENDRGQMEWDNAMIVVSGNKWPTQYPEIGNISSSKNGDISNIPNQNPTPQSPNETPSRSGGSSGGGCNSGIGMHMLAGIALVKFVER